MIFLGVFFVLLLQVSFLTETGKMSFDRVFTMMFLLIGHLQI